MRMLSPREMNQINMLIPIVAEFAMDLQQCRNNLENYLKRRGSQPKTRSMGKSSLFASATPIDTSAVYAAAESVIGATAVLSNYQTTTINDDLRRFIKLKDVKNLQLQSSEVLDDISTQLGAAALQANESVLSMLGYVNLIPDPEQQEFVLYKGKPVTIDEANPLLISETVFAIEQEALENAANQLEAPQETVTDLLDNENKRNQNISTSNSSDGELPETAPRTPR